jgi:DNA-binding response OmpR family regulator
VNRVLVIEDDASLAKLVKGRLHDEGFVWIHAADAAGGWESLEADTPDAAIVDLRSNGHGSGWDLLDRIRGTERFRDLPVVIMDPAPTRERAERATSNRAELLPKPFSSAALIDRLRRAMRTAGRSPEIRAQQCLILTTSGFWIEGEAHVPRDLHRFSDAWEAVVDDARDYVPITGAVVKTLEGKTLVAKTDLVEVAKQHVIVVSPVEP